MFELIWHLFIIAFQLVEFLCLLAVPVMIVWVSSNAWKIYRYGEPTIATLIDYRFVATEKQKRDYANDTIRTEYEFNFFSPDVETTYRTKAYKWVREEKYESQYQYIVDDQEFSFNTTESVAYTKNGERLPPPESKEVYYMRNKPYKSIEKEYYSSLILMALAAITAYIIMSLIFKGTKILVLGYIILASAYAYLIKLYVDLKKGKV